MKRKILIVEDSFEVRVALEMAFQQEGYDERAFVDAESAEQAFEEFRPDLVLLDMRLPGMSGIELCRIIRETSFVPIVMFSAVEEASEKIAAFEAGADDYVIKGTGVDELLARVTSHLRWERRPAPEDGDSTDLFEDTQTAEPPAVEAAPADAKPAAPQQNPAKAKTLKSRLPKRRIEVPQHSFALGSAVLIADPDADHRDRLSRLLKRLGHEVIETADGRQTLKTVGKYVPWLVFCDIVMPDMNGKRILEILKDHPKTRDVAVIVVSKVGSPDVRLEANQLGALDYIVKPWQDHEVELRIKWAKDALERRKVRVDAA